MTPDALVDDIARAAGLARRCPVIVYVRRAGRVERRGARSSRSAAGHGPSRRGSPERLLDQTAFFLHRRWRRCPRQAADARGPAPDGPGARGQEGADRRRRHPEHLRADQHPGAARTWRSSRRRPAGTRSRMLQTEPDIDIVLMDIMMPEMDGIETMRAIRKIPRFRNLPIVAVTAKAMKGDREKCIEAGAWDYLSKPVDTERVGRRAARLARSVSPRRVGRGSSAPARSRSNPGRGRPARQADRDGGDALSSARTSSRRVGREALRQPA